MLSNKEISVEAAIRLRDDPGRKRNSLPDFRCIKCSLPVRPHKEGKKPGSAHFEHHARNAKCPLSDPLPH
jgi:hypothetical protein